VNFGNENGEAAGGSGGRSDTVLRTASGEGSFFVNGWSEKPWAFADEAQVDETTAKAIRIDMV